MPGFLQATVIRTGLLEMKKLSQAIYPTVQDSTFLESCGLADLVATCYGGRNRRIAEAFAVSITNGERKSFAQLEVIVICI